MAGLEMSSCLIKENIKRIKRNQKKQADSYFEIAFAIERMAGRKTPKYVLDKNVCLFYLRTCPGFCPGFLSRT